MTKRSSKHVLTAAFIITGPQMSHCRPPRYDSKALRNWNRKSGKVVPGDGREIPFAICAASFVPFSHHTIKVDEVGRIEKADDVEQVPVASTAGLSVVSDRSHKWFP